MNEAIAAAKAAWEKAPRHIQMMAGVYVVPLLSALESVAAEVEALKGAANGQS